MRITAQEPGEVDEAMAHIRALRDAWRCGSTLGPSDRRSPSAERTVDNWSDRLLTI
jgi:hypothetical protein